MNNYYQWGNQQQEMSIYWDKKQIFSYVCEYDLHLACFSHEKFTLRIFYLNFGYATQNHTI